MRQTTGLRYGRSVGYARALTYFGWHLLQRQEWARAEGVLRQCLGLREKLQPEAWGTYSARAMLGGALLGQKQFAQAEPLLLAGCQGLQRHQQEIPSPDKLPLRDALERLVQLYEEWDKAEPNSGKLDMASRWRRDLEALQGK